MGKRFLLKVVKPMLNNKGFTLLEMLLVLSIICMTSFLTLTFHQPKISQEQAIMQIENFIYAAKLNAMVNKEKTNITLNRNTMSYQSTSTKKSMSLDSQIYCSKYQFSYNTNGNIYKASTVKYTIYGKKVKFVFQVGSGSFEIR